MAGSQDRAPNQSLTFAEHPTLAGTDLPESAVAFIAENLRHSEVSGNVGGTLRQVVPKAVRNVALTKEGPSSAPVDLEANSMHFAVGWSLGLERQFVSQFLVCDHLNQVGLEVVGVQESPTSSFIGHHEQRILFVHPRGKLGEPRGAS